MNEVREAIRHHVRYETPDENGETRKQRNEKFGMAHLTPEITVPDDLQYLFDLFFQFSDGLQRFDANGNPVRAGWQNLQAWCWCSGIRLHPYEVDLIQEMDAAFVAEMTVEVQNYRLRQQDKAEREAKAKQNGGPS